MGIEPRNDCKIFISGFPPFQDSLTTLVVKYFGTNPQWSILAKTMLTEPGMWTVWAAAKSPSVWLPQPCLVLSLPLSLPLSLGWPQGPVGRSRGNQLVCILMALFIWTVTVINSIISYLLCHCEEHARSHGKKNNLVSIWNIWNNLKNFPKRS